jgi:hypothetical protein
MCIIKDSGGKTGVYRGINKENGNSYVGSAVDLRKRFYSYFNLKTIARDNMVINKALIKYGYSTFKLEILEYCDKGIVISREQYYIDLLKPRYNILSTAGSSLGYNHTEGTKLKILDSSPRRVEVEVLDLETNITTIYSSMRQAARGLNADSSSLKANIVSKQQKPYRGRYVLRIL